MELEDIKKSFIMLNDYQLINNNYYSSLSSLFENLMKITFIDKKLIEYNLQLSLSIHYAKNKKYNGYLVHILTEEEMDIIITELYNLYSS